MTESLLGILIAAMAISTFTLSIQSIERAYKNAGKHSLTKEEIEIIKSAGLNTESNFFLLKTEIENLPQKF